MVPNFRMQSENYVHCVYRFSAGSKEEYKSQNQYSPREFDKKGAKRSLPEPEAYWRAPPPSLLPFGTAGGDDAASNSRAFAEKLGQTGQPITRQRDHLT